MIEAIHEFKRLIQDATTLEPTMQRFMENHTEFIPTFVYRLHHGVWLNSVFSQLQVGPRKSDFAFLTKHTQQHRIVLIEIEAPGKVLFTNAPNYVVASAALNNALDQVRAWQRDLKATPNLLANVGAVFDSAYDSPPEVKFVLVIGNSDEWVNDGRRSRYLSEIEGNQDIQIIGYDTISLFITKLRACSEAVLTCTTHGGVYDQANERCTKLFARNAWSQSPSSFARTQKALSKSRV
jgi:hypothetical protein